MTPKLGNLVGLLIAMASLIVSSSSAMAETEDNGDLFKSEYGLRGVDNGETSRKLEGNNGKFFFAFDVDGVSTASESNSRQVGPKTKSRAEHQKFLDEVRDAQVSSEGFDASFYENRKIVKDFTTDAAGKVEITPCDSFPAQSRYDSNFIIDEGNFLRFECASQGAYALTTEKPIFGFGFYADYQADAFTDFQIETSLYGVDKKIYTHKAKSGETASYNLCFFGIVDTEPFNTIKFSHKYNARDPNVGFDTLTFASNVPIGPPVECLTSADCSNANLNADCLNECFSGSCQPICKGDDLQVTIVGVPAQYFSPHPDADRGVEIEVIFERDNESFVNGDTISLVAGDTYRWRAVAGGIAGPWQQYTAGPAIWDVSTAFSEITVRRQNSLKTIQIRGSERVLTKGQPFTVPVGAKMFLRGVSPYAIGGFWREYEVPAGASSKLSARSGLTAMTVKVPEDVKSRDGSPVKVTLIPYGDGESPVRFSKSFLFPRGSKIRLQVEVNGFKSRVIVVEVPDVANYEIDIGAAFTGICVTIPDWISDSTVNVYLNRFEMPFTQTETVYLPSGSTNIVLTKIELGQFAYAPRTNYKVSSDAFHVDIDTTEHFDGIVVGGYGCG